MSKFFQFAQFDPRPQGAEANAKIFTEASNGVLGIEVTIPELAEKCQLGNLDHHGPGSSAETPSACEQALTWVFPWWWGSPKEDEIERQSEGLPGRFFTLATVRPDADSVTAMAVLSTRAEGAGVDEDLVRAVGRMDRHGPAAITARDDRVVAIARISADFKRTLGERVAWVRGLLAGNGEQEAEVASLVAERDKEFVAAEAASEISLAADGRIAVVQSTHRFATNLGYERATVVVAFNPEMPVDFRDASKGTYRKYTVCRYDSHVPANLEAALADLQSKESGWGGRGDIFGSPQGVSSSLSLDEVVKVIARHLK